MNEKQIEKIGQTSYQMFNMGLFNVDIPKIEKEVENIQKEISTEKDPLKRLFLLLQELIAKEKMNFVKMCALSKVYKEQKNKNVSTIDFIQEAIKIAKNKETFNKFFSTSKGINILGISDGYLKFSEHSEQKEKQLQNMFKIIKKEQEEQQHIEK